MYHGPWTIEHVLCTLYHTPTHPLTNPPPTHLPATNLPSPATNPNPQTWNPLESGIPREPQKFLWVAVGAVPASKLRGIPVEPQVCLWLPVGADTVEVYGISYLVYGLKFHIIYSM